MLVYTLSIAMLRIEKQDVMAPMKITGRIQAKIDKKKRTLRIEVTDESDQKYIVLNKRELRKLVKYSAKIESDIARLKKSAIIHSDSSSSDDNTDDQSSGSSSSSDSDSQQPMSDDE